MATPAKPPIDANAKAGILMAVAQLDMLIQAFGEAPERVQKAAKEFQEALKEWAT